MKQYVLNAEAGVAATGESLWIQFVFHRYCDAHCGAYTVQPAKFTALLDFLAGGDARAAGQRADHGRGDGGMSRRR